MDCVDWKCCGMQPKSLKMSDLSHDYCYRYIRLLAVDLYVLFFGSQQGVTIVLAYLEGFANNIKFNRCEHTDYIIEELKNTFIVQLPACYTDNTIVVSTLYPIFSCLNLHFFNCPTCHNVGLPRDEIWLEICLQ